jgi:hypothetical protein
MADPTVPGPAFVPPNTNPFRAYFQDRRNDPYDRKYVAVMLYFIEYGHLTGPQALYDMVASSSPNMGAIIVMFEDPYHEEGRSLTLHGIHMYKSVMGRPTEWDKRSFAFVN